MSAPVIDPTSVPVRPLSVVAGAFDTAIRLYQTLTAARPSPCRFTPSCSTYAREAIAQRGAGRGTLLAIRRLSRCHPWGGTGFDPVPNHRVGVGARPTDPGPVGSDTSPTDRGNHV